MARNTPLEDFTVVVANSQTKGRGQVNKSWFSEPFKNLTFSIFKHFSDLEIQQKPYLNFAISLAVFKTLESLCIPNLKVKWPNDIMADNKKVCGLLIETTFQKQYIKNAIIGVGLNVNQEVFPADLPHANSLKNILGKEFNLNDILESLTDNIQKQLQTLQQGKLESIYQEYLTSLYRKNIPSVFINSNQQKFMGVISSVSKEGKLIVKLEDESYTEFDTKEVTLATI